MGRYLYGAGYFSRDDNTLGLLRGGSNVQHFCLRCPKVKDCEDAHERRVRELMPAAVETFERKMAEAVRRGVPPTLAAAFLGRDGMDPFALTAVENFNLGHADRGRVSGPLVK